MKKSISLILTSLALVACGKTISSSNENIVSSSSKEQTIESSLSSETPSEVSSESSTSETSSEESSSINNYAIGDLSIASPTGAPALAFYNYAEARNFETNSVPNNIVAMMSAGQKDVIILPTNAGVQAIANANAEYKIAATITFGNFYIASLNNDSNGEMDASDTILLFQKNNVPDKIFHYVYGDSFNSNIHYVSAVNDAASALIGGKFTDPDSGTQLTPNYVMVAEPALTNVLSKKGDAVSVYANLQEEYKKKSNNQELFQASVFIKNSVDHAKGESFLQSLKKDIEDAIAEPSKLSAGMNKARDTAQTLYGVAPAMAQSVLAKNNGMGLGFKYARDNKSAINTFLGLFNIQGIDESIYF